MFKTAINSGWRAVTGWFRAMQDLSYSKASNEVGHLPTPDGIGGTWKTFSVTPAPSKTLSFDGWEHNVVLNILCPPFDSLTIPAFLSHFVRRVIARFSYVMEHPYYLELNGIMV